MANGMINRKQAAGLGALAATAVTAGAAAAGYYFYASKDASKHRKIAAKWAMNMKSDVMKQARQMKKFDQKMLGMVIAQAAKKYEVMKSVDKKDVAKAVKELRANWQNIAAELQKGAKKTAKTAKKIAKKTAKKVAKKVAKKTAKRK